MEKTKVIILLLLTISYSLSPLIPICIIRTIFLIAGFFLVGFLTVLLLLDRINVSSFTEVYVLSYAFGVLIVESMILILGFLKLLHVAVPVISLISAVLLFILRNREFNLPSVGRRDLTIILYSLAIFVVNTLTLNHNIVHLPDEYQYIYVARNMITSSILCMNNYPITPPWPIIRPAYHLVNVYILTYNDICFYPSQIYSTFIHSMIVPATYILVSQLGYGNPALASLFIGVNPIMIWHSRKVLSDITYTFYFIITLYFFLKIFNKDMNKNALTFFFTFYTLAFFTKISLVLAIPPFIYYSIIKSYKKYLTKNVLFFVIPLIVLSELYLSVIATPRNPTEAPASTPSWSKSMLMQFLEPFTYSLDEWHYFLFEDWGRAHGTFVFPYYYSHAVALLILAGFIRFIVKMDKNRFFIVFLTGMFIWYFSTRFGIGEARMVFPIYPILMMFASSMLSPIKGKYVFALLLLAPFMLPYPGESENVFIIQGISQDCIMISKILGLITLILIILNSYLHKVIKIVFSNKISLTYSLNIVYCIILVVIAISSLHTANCILFKQLFPENSPILDTGIPDVATYLMNSNLTKGVITNVFFELPYYMNYTEIYRIPRNETIFKEMLKNGTIKVIVLSKYKYYNYRLLLIYNYLENYIYKNRGFFELVYSDDGRKTLVYVVRYSDSKN